jgi:hypothetical protein
VVNRRRADTPARVLAGAVRLFPPRHREWGRAMRAELTTIGPRRARWHFALGCVRVVATQRRTVGYPSLVIVALVGTVAATRTVGYAPLHWGLVALVATLVTVPALVRRPGLVGAAADGRVSRLVRAGGGVLVGATAVGVVLDMRSTTTNLGEKAAVGVPVYTVVLATYLLGFLTVTAARSAATARALATGAGAGVAGGVAWSIVVLVHPPIPGSAASALAVTAVVMGAAAAANARGQGGALAALCAGTVSTLLIVAVVAVLARYGPPTVIPDLVPAALTPARRIAESRIEVEDPYVAVLVLGGLLAALLSVVAVGTRRPGTVAR